jgi:S1-C subfamily serine protease
MITGTPQKGMSGGPLINLGGEVLGVAFGAARDDSDTGYALTANEITAKLVDLGNTAPVATGRELC